MNTASDPEFIALQAALAGEYSLERELGRGGMGIVYLAREVQLDRLVAIKVLPQSLAERGDLRERFVREARMAARLSHPHIVPIFRVGEAGGFVFFVMAYVHGETLGNRLRTRGPLTPDTAAKLLREVAWALAYAHGHGIVHRDVKPDNILLEGDTGRALVTDFGIARAGTDDNLTDPGRLMGTAHFMSPEQGASAPLDGRSDLYSLGVVGFLALSGRVPFDAPSVPAMLVKHATEAAPSLASVVGSVPPRLAAVIDRCLRKMPDERYASGEELADELTTLWAPRRQVPMPLRMWAQQSDPLRMAYYAWSGIFTAAFFSQAGRVGGGDPAFMAAMALLPVVPSMVYHARKAKRAFDAGYSLADLRATLKEWRAQRREELGFQLAERPPLLGRAVRVIAWSAIGTVAITALTPFHLPRSLLAMRVIAMATIFGGVGGLVAANALGVPMFGRTLRRRLEGSLRSWFWNSKAGELVTKLLSRKDRAIASETAYRPTEVALGIAVDDLYAALPRASQQQLRRLPDTVRELETSAADARRRVEEMTTPSLREQAKRELAETVTVLESIRLDLLRLHGGANDLSPLTAVLERARELGQELDALKQGNEAVYELRPQTPV